MQAKSFVLGIGIAVTLMLFSVTSVLRDLDSVCPQHLLFQRALLCPGKNRAAFCMILRSSMRIVLSENLSPDFYLWVPKQNPLSKRPR